MEVRFDDSDWNQLAEAGVSNRDPLSYLAEKKGLFGSMMYRPQPRPGEFVVPGLWNVHRTPDGRYRTTYGVAFSEQNMDPLEYRNWVSMTARKINAPIKPSR
jgi:hypothetical protein